MNEVLRIELEAVQYQGNDVVRADAEGHVDAYAVYIVTDADTDMPHIGGCKAAKMFLPRFVADFASQEDAHTAAVSLATSIGVIVQNNIPKSIQFTRPYVEFAYEPKDTPIPLGRTFFYENGGLEFDINKYQRGAAFESRLQKRTMRRPGMAREMSMHILKDDTILNANDKVCVMNGMEMCVFYYEPLAQVINNNNRYVVIDRRSREVIEGSPVVPLQDANALIALEMFAAWANG